MAPTHSPRFPKNQRRLLNIELGGGIQGDRSTKPGWGVGTIVAILLSVSVYFIGFVSLQGMVSLILLLCGLWTVVVAFVVVERKDRSYYSGWGVVIAALSLSYFIQLQYALAVILLAIIALIIINIYIGKTPKNLRSSYESTMTRRRDGRGQGYAICS